MHVPDLDPAVEESCNQPLSIGTECDGSHIVAWVYLKLLVKSLMKSSELALGFGEAVENADPGLVIELLGHVLFNVFKERKILSAIDGAMK
jgi:hypothetical protein